MTSDRLEIPLDRRRPARFLAASLIGLLGSAYAVAALQGDRTGLRSALHSFALMASVFFALSAFAMARRLLVRTPGLVLDAEGIVDRSSDMGAGRVRWDEVEEVRVTRSSGRRFLTLIVQDPRKFIERGGWVHRRVNEANYRHAGSPVNVATWTLRIPFDQLLARMSEFYRRYGKR